MSANPRSDTIPSQFTVTLVNLHESRRSGSELWPIGQKCVVELRCEGFNTAHIERKFDHVLTAGELLDSVADAAIRMRKMVEENDLGYRSDEERRSGRRE